MPTTPDRRCHACHPQTSRAATVIQAITIDDDGPTRHIPGVPRCTPHAQEFRRSLAGVTTVTLHETRP